MCLYVHRNIFSSSLFLFFYLLSVIPSSLPSIYLVRVFSWETLRCNRTKSTFGLSLLISNAFVNSCVLLHDNSNVHSTIQLLFHVVDVQLWLHLVTGLLPSSMRGVWTTRKECEYLLLTSSSSSLSVASSSSSTSSWPPSSSSWSSEKDIKGNRLNSTKPQKVLIWFLSESKNSIWTKSNFFH